MHFILENNLYSILLAFLAGIVASFIGGITSGGGSIVSISTLLFLGLPPSVAIATDRFGQLGWILSTTYRFFKSKKIVYKYLVSLSIISIIGGLIGASFLVKINQTYLSIIIGVIILFLLIFMLFKKNIGMQTSKPVLDIRLGFFLYFLSAIYDAFLGMAGGIFVAYLFIFVFGLTYTQANATEKIPLFFNSAIAITIFAMGGLINYVLGAALLLGNLIGGYLGAHMAIQKGDGFVRIFFICVCIVSAVKLIFFP